MNFKWVERVEYSDELKEETMDYYNSGHNKEETKDYINGKYGVSKAEIARFIQDSRKKEPTVSEIIESQGGMVFIKEMLLNNYNLRMVAKALGVSYTGLNYYVYSRGLKARDFYAQRKVEPSKITVNCIKEYAKGDL